MLKNPFRNPKTAPTDDNTYKKIQLCVCFPTHNTQQMTLNYKPDKDSSPKHIVTIETPINQLNDDNIQRINKLYYYLNLLFDNGANIKFEEDGDNIIDIESISDITVDKLKKMNIGYNDISSLTNDMNTILSDFKKSSDDRNQKIEQEQKVKEELEKNLEVDGGYFDKGKKIYYLKDGNQFMPVGEFATIENIIDASNIRVKHKNDNIYDISLSNIYFHNENIKNTKCEFDLKKKFEYNKDKNIKTVVLYQGIDYNFERRTNIWYLGEIDSIDNDKNTYKIHEYNTNTPVNLTFDVDNRCENIRYVQTYANGKILTSQEVTDFGAAAAAAAANGGSNYIPITKYSKPKTAKNQRRRRKRAGKTRHRKFVV